LQHVRYSKSTRFLYNPRRIPTSFIATPRYQPHPKLGVFPRTTNLRLRAASRSPPLGESVPCCRESFDAVTLHVAGQPFSGETLWRTYGGSVGLLGNRLFFPTRRVILRRPHGFRGLAQERQGRPCGRIIQRAADVGVLGRANSRRAAPSRSPGGSVEVKRLGPYGVHSYACGTSRLVRPSTSARQRQRSAPTWISTLLPPALSSHG